MPPTPLNPVRLACTPLEDRTTPAPLMLVVDTPNDIVNPNDGLTSLREAIQAAEASFGKNERAEISFTSALRGAEISVTEIGGFRYSDGTAFEIVSGQTILILGTGQRITRVTSGPDPLDFRLFGIGNQSQLELRDVEIVGGRAVIGGGIYNDGILTIDRCTITGNVATGGNFFQETVGGEGGGIYNSFGTLRITNSTITGNTALSFSLSGNSIPGVGGGLANEDGTAILNYVTIADNTAAIGTQVYNLAEIGRANLAVNFSILSVAGGTPNHPSLVSEGVGNGIDSATGVKNLIRGETGFTGEIVSNADPLLGPLQNNGGLTRTRSIAPPSQAVDAGEPVPTNVVIDQRGVPRVNQGIATDLGAFEFLVPVIPPPPIPPAQLSGFVYVDDDDDGVKDPGEAPIPGVLITLTSGTITLTTATGADGSYSFTNLPPDRYTVTEIQPSGFLDGKDTAGSLGGTVTNDRIADIPLGGGANSINNNFGELIPPPPPPPVLVVGAGPGGGPHVKVFNTFTGAEVASFFAFDRHFLGGVRVAQGDFNRDGIADIVAGAGLGGGPHVKVFDGATGAEIRSFFAFAPEFTGGVYVASADLTDDGVADIVVGAGLDGGPHVKLIDGATGDTVLSFFAYGLNINCGVSVACGNGRIVTGAGFGHPAWVKVFDAHSGTELYEFYASDTKTEGVNVAIGPLEPRSIGPLSIYTGSAHGSAPVRKYLDTTPSAVSFTAFVGVFSGVTVAAGYYDRDATPDFAVGAGGGTPQVRVYDGLTGVERLSFFAFDPGFAGGVFVG
jgi:hypothetical protein